MGLKSWIAWQGADIIYGFVARVFWPRSSAGALVIQENNILAVDMGDYLMLPSGGLEYGESFEEAAIREAFEETGYKIEIKEKVSKEINSVGGPEIIFEADLVTGENMKSKGWGEPVWIPVEEVGEKDWRYNRNIKRILNQKQVNI